MCCLLVAVHTCRPPPHPRAAFVAAAGICAGDSQQAASSSAAWLLNPLCLLGAAGLGVALVQIHIYVTPIKRALQVRARRFAVSMRAVRCWSAAGGSAERQRLLLLPLPPPPLPHQLLGLAGAAGAAWLALSHGEQPLPLQVVAQPWTVWLVGPAAAAVTGAWLLQRCRWAWPAGHHRASCDTSLMLACTSVRRAVCLPACCLCCLLHVHLQPQVSPSKRASVMER